jgi:hypothetical protein
MPTLLADSRTTGKCMADEEDSKTCDYKLPYFPTARPASPSMPLIWSPLFSALSGGPGRGPKLRILCYPCRGCVGL